jgi:pilus assembly protein CpaF
MAARLAFVIAGGTGTGKTTLLGALLSLCPPSERIVLIEDVPELVLDHPHLVRLLGRTANIEGAGAVGPAELVRQALRMRPDRLVVGEFRGAEFAELLAALNTGHEGGAATVHANAVADVPARFAALGSLTGLDSAAVSAQVASAFQVIIQLRRGADRRRRVVEVATLAGGGVGQLPVVSVWTAAGVGPGAERLAQQLRDRSVAVPEMLR